MSSNSIISLPEQDSIPVFCFNGNMSKIAMSPNTKQVMIFAKEGNGWKLETTLTEHTETVTGIDWAKNANRLLTCAADRNAYVWNLDANGKWTPSLVLLRIDRAAICCRWSPAENKFAVGTGSKLICVCYYEEGNDWWVSKHIKKPIRSSVLSIDWHPSGTILAAGSSDFCVRVFSAAVKEVEKKPEKTVWGDKIAFGSILAEFKNPNDGWVHSVSFSPSGTRLVWVSHDSTVTVADCSSGTPTTVLVKLNLLPFKACVFLSEDTIVAAGHNNSPYKFKYEGSSLSLVGDIDTGPSKAQTSSENISAMSRFKNMDTLAQSKGVETAAASKTHANTITSMTLLSGSKLASSGLDSKIVIWEKV